MKLRLLESAMPEPRDISTLRGYVVSLSLTGSITPQFSQCFFNMARYNDEIGLKKVEYEIKPGLFVESARDDAILHALDPRGDRSETAYDWCLQLDADATFPKETLQRLIQQAYINFPNCGVIGAYSQLKPFPHLPTIDTGTGTWEEHYPGEGVVPVIRTGCHCILIKTAVFSKIGPPPWFRTRLAQQPIRAMREVDNFARTKLSGRNPLRDHAEWGTLFEAAMQASTARENVVGEDSAFFDRCKAHNVPVLVDCDLQTGHVAQKIIAPSDYKDAVRKSRTMQRAALGVYGGI